MIAPPFTEYRSQDRLRDFTTIFGDDLHMLETRVQRFMAELP